MNEELSISFVVKYSYINCMRPIFILKIFLRNIFKTLLYIGFSSKRNQIETKYTLCNFSFQNQEMHYIMCTTISTNSNFKVN